MTRWQFYTAIFLLLCPLPLFAASPASLQELLEVSVKHYPQIQQAAAQREANEAAVKQALGAFDATFENSSSLRAAGFYDGNYTSSKVVKPLMDYNARVSAGYRVSDGSFPIYDDYLYTNSGGEFNFELFFSLLRDRDIDDDRLRFWNSQLQVSKAEQELLLSKIATQRAAMIAYYEWIAASQILAIQQELTDLAKERQKALKKKHEHGDIAAITVTENEQYLFRREGQLNDAQRLYRNAAVNLSLYWRDAEGNPIVPQGIGSKDFPVLAGGAAVVAKAEAAELYRIRPELKLIEAEIETQKNEMRAGENSLLPRTDIMLRSAQDMGSGSFSRDEAEHVVGLNISIPLQRRFGEGRVSKARAKLRALEQEQRFMRDQIAQQLQYLENDLHAAERYIDWSAKEVEVANKMQTSESQLFASGGSDYFLLNMREEQRASAKVKNVSAKLDYYRALANAYAAAMKLDKFEITS